MEHVSVFESIADRRIRDARAAGLFDDLPGAGKPIPDLDRIRPPGWWATQLVKRERSIIKAEELEEELRSAMPGLWRSRSAAAVRAKVDELNLCIDNYNQITTWDRRTRLDTVDMVRRWERLDHLR